MDRLESKVNLESSASTVSSPNSSSRRSTADSVEHEDDMIIPSMEHIRSSTTIQRQVDARLRELTQDSEKGKFKSKRGGADTVWVKNDIQWPQNHILGGSSKTRVSYDSLSISQWVAGFASIVRDEGDVQTKNQMLEYLSDLMEDSHDFGWAAAKSSHAVLLCKMEEGRVHWNQVDKIDRIRRVHAQRLSGPPAQYQAHKQSSAKVTPCRYYNRGQCSHKTSHETNGANYLHVCSHCFTQGRTSTHPVKDC